MALVTAGNTLYALGGYTGSGFEPHAEAFALDVGALSWRSVAPLHSGQVVCRRLLSLWKTAFWSPARTAARNVRPAEDLALGQVALQAGRRVSGAAGADADAGGALQRRVC
jgi:hypothetical protein